MSSCMKRLGIKQTHLKDQKVENIRMLMQHVSYYCEVIGKGPFFLPVHMLVCLTSKRLLFQKPFRTLFRSNKFWRPARVPQSSAKSCTSLDGLQAGELISRILLIKFLLNITYSSML